MPGKSAAPGGWPAPAPAEVASLKVSWSSGQGTRLDIWRLGVRSSLLLLCCVTLSRLLGLSVLHLPCLASFLEGARMSSAGRFHAPHRADGAGTCGHSENASARLQGWGGRAQALQGGNQGRESDCCSGQVHRLMPQILPPDLVPNPAHDPCLPGDAWTLTLGSFSEPFLQLSRNLPPPPPSGKAPPQNADPKPSWATPASWGLRGLS